MAGPPPRSWLTREVLLVSLSACFADMGYQAVTAVFPLLIVSQLNEPAYVYGILLALAFGVGSLVAFVGGRLGDRYNKKHIALAGNLLIPLMSLGGLFSSIWIVGALFVFGWWARYFRTPARRAILVEVSDPAYRSKAFGFLHALDVGGGLIAVAYSILLVLFHVPLNVVLLVTMIPILTSSACLALVRYTPSARPAAPRPPAAASGPEAAALQEEIRSNRFVFRALLLSATLFGFSYYALGFPILTVAETESSAVLGMLTFGIYLGVSSVAGYVLGSRSLRPIRTLWTLGYALAALASLTIGASYVLNSGLLVFYLGAAGLGFATGAIETFEPVLTSNLVAASDLSSGMGLLSMTRALGLFFSNLAMGLLFTLNQFDSYVYAFGTAVVAAVILAQTERSLLRRKKVPPRP